MKRLLKNMNIQCRMMEREFRLFQDNFDSEKAKELAENYQFDQTMRYAFKCLIAFAGGACLGAVSGTRIAHCFDCAVPIGSLSGSLGTFFLVTKVIYSYKDLQMYLDDIGDSVANKKKVEAMMGNKLVRMKFAMEGLLDEESNLSQEQKQYAEYLLSSINRELDLENLPDLEALKKEDLGAAEASSSQDTLTILFNRPSGERQVPPSAPVLAAAGAGALTGATGAIAASGGQ